MKIKDLLIAASKRLGGDAARLDAEMLLAYALNTSRSHLYAWPEREVDASQRAVFDRLIAARERGEPIAYLTGQREFWSLDLAVTPDVLIPRHETELLVELALVRIAVDREVRVADLGTGSGAIALAIARERPHAHVVATEASAAALEVARGNATRLDLRNVTFAPGDWCTALGAERFDIIVSNPPYISADDAHLGEGDLRFEPIAALASGRDGLDAIRKIVAAAGAHLVAGGWLLLEHGWDQASRVRSLLKVGGYADAETFRDGAGHERATVASWRA